VFSEWLLSNFETFRVENRGYYSTSTVIYAMLIGELVKRPAFSKDTIRFDEKEGLIEVSPGERRAHNYKDYRENVFEHLLKIKDLKDLRFTLHEVQTFLKALRDKDARCHDITYARRKSKPIDDQLETLSRPGETALFP
jgi:MerR family transcriptional regulator, copper efflux regulator